MMPGQVNFGNPNQTMMNDQTIPGIKKCIGDIQDGQSIQLTNNKAFESYTFDYVAGEEVGQDDIFQRVGKPIVDQCLQGYNGSIFAYGQTGSGKTYTIQGANYENDQFTEQEKSLRGLLPRCFEYLFTQINKIKNKHNIHQCKGKRSARLSDITHNASDDNIQDIVFDVKCSYLEIYNENIIDLLDPSQIKVQVREERERGVFADPCTEEKVVSIQEVMNLIQKGSRNRHIACTNMNRESSRSHAVFTAVIKTITTKINNEQIVRTAMFHIVDLAGSERCKETGAEGLRLKEASAINKSLTTLGGVINDLAEISKSNDLTKVRSKHIRYRDSKLTYLLRDSLGGNAQTVMICNINPHICALKETRSTLQFAQRAKMIKNKAVVNQENTSASYWKNKYNDLIKFGRSNTVPNVNNNDLSIDRNFTDLTSSKYRQNVQLFLEAQQHIKSLTQQLKEEKLKREEQSATFSKASEDMYKFKNSLKFQLQLVQAREQKLLEDHFKLIQPNITQEIVGLKELINSQKREIEQLKGLVESNPHLAARHARVKELEQQVDDLQKRAGSQDLTAITIDKILNYLERTISYFEIDLEHKRGVNGRMNNDNDQMELDGGDETQTQHIKHDLSSITVNRSDEIANIKLKYEDQLDQLRTQIHNLESKNRQYLNIIGQKSSTLQDSQGSRDSQNFLLTQRTQNLQGSLPLQVSQTQTFRKGGDMQTQGFNVEEIDQLLDDMNNTISEKDKKIELLEDELLAGRNNVQKLTNDNEVLLKNNIDLEAYRIQIEDQLQLAKSRNTELVEENEDLLNKYQDLENVREENEKLVAQVRELAEDNQNYQDSHEYFQHQMIPQMQNDMGIMRVQLTQQQNDINHYKSENENLKQRRNRDQEIEQLEADNQNLNAQIRQKEHDLNQLHVTLQNCYHKVEEMDRYINEQNSRISDLLEKDNNLQEDIKEYKAQYLSKERQCQELEEVSNELQQKLVQDRNKYQCKLDSIMTERDNIIKRQEQELRRIEEENKLIRSDRAELQTHMYLQNQNIQDLQNQNSELIQSYNELKKKYDQILQMQNQYTAQNEKAMEAIQKYRRTSNDNSSQKEELIKQLTQSKLELKEQIKIRDQKLGALESQLKSYQEQHEKYLREEIGVKLRRLECENISVKQEKEMLSVQVGQLEAKICMLQDELKRVQGDFDNLGKQNNKLLTSNNPNAKASYLTQQRENYNQARKEVTQLQDEVKVSKKRLDDTSNKLLSFYNELRSFGAQLAKICNAHSQCLVVKGDMVVSEYFNILLQIVKEAILLRKSYSEPIDVTQHNASFNQSESNSNSSGDSLTKQIFQDPFKNQFSKVRAPDQRSLNNSMSNQENFNHQNQFNNTMGLKHVVQHQIPFKIPQQMNTHQTQSSSNGNSFQQVKPEQRGRQLGNKTNQPQSQITGSTFKLSNLHLSRARDKSNNSGMDIDT